MKKWVSRLLSFVCVMALAMSMAVPAFADYGVVVENGYMVGSYYTDGYELGVYYEGTQNGSNYSWKLDEDGTLSIRGVRMPDGNFSEAYAWCKYGFRYPIRKIIFEEGIQNIGLGFTLGDYHKNSRAVEDVQIASSVKKIGREAFWECDRLKTVNIPNTVQYIGEAAFRGCDRLEAITIPSSVEDIEDKTFLNCISLRNVTIQSEVKSIGKDAFLGCDSLTNVTFTGTQAQWNALKNNSKSGNNALWNASVTITNGVPAAPIMKPSSFPNWLTDGAGAWQHTDASGAISKGVLWMEENGVGNRYIFDNTGLLCTGDSEGDVLINGNLYFINPNKNLSDPRTCYAVRDYTRIRPNVGITYYDNDGITFVGWINAGAGKRMYQTIIHKEDIGAAKDLYIYVWRAQYLPACQDPDHPGDAAYMIPEGWYLFGEDGVLVQQEGWHACNDGKNYYTNAQGQILQTAS